MNANTRKLVILLAVFSYPALLLGSEPCQVIRGRVHFYNADGQLRLWQIGTHHEFDPDYFGADKGASWDRIVELLKAGDESAGAASNNDLYADFTVCPTESYRPGSVQHAVIKGFRHARVVLAR
jgi:hypothetical protein